MSKVSSSKAWGISEYVWVPACEHLERSEVLHGL